MAEMLDEAWGWLVGKLLEWALATLQTMLVWWMSDSAYSLRLSGEPDSVLWDLREHTNWLTAVMAFAGFLVAAFRIAVQRRGEPFREALSHFFELTVIVLTIATAVNLANVAADRYSAWIIRDLMPDEEWIEGWNSGIRIIGGNETDTAFILAFFALAATIATAVQFMLMLFRSGALIVMVGVLPTLAASRFSAYGNHAYKKCIAWTISWILFKPVAATIYAAALALMGPGKSEADRLFGLALVAGAIFVLPATMRAVVPPLVDDHKSFSVRQTYAAASGVVNWAEKVGTVFGLGKGGPSGGKVAGRSSGGGSGGGASRVRTGHPSGGGPARGGSRGGSPDGSAGGASGGGSANDAFSNGPGGDPFSGGPSGGTSGDPSGSGPAGGESGGRSGGGSSGGGAGGGSRNGGQAGGGQAGGGQAGGGPAGGQWNAGGPSGSGGPRS